MNYKRGYQCQIRGLEDIYLDTFGYIGDGFFVEVGAFDCYTWSNTWGLVQAGWSGIYFEPNPEGYNKCQERFGSSEKIRVIKRAISDREGEAMFITAGSVSTLKDDVADIYANSKSHNIAGVSRKNKILVEMSYLDLELVRLDAPKPIDVLVVDVEGSELDVLRGFSPGTWRPTLVIVEAHESHPNAALRAAAIGINIYMEAAGYEKIHSDHINNIYRKYWKNGK